MKYSVSYQGNNFISTIISIIIFPIFIAVCAYFLATGQTDRKATLIIGIIFFSLFTLLMIYALYRSIRPRIHVCDGTVTYYPLWQRKRVVDIEKLDRRVEKDIDYTNKNWFTLYFELLVYRNATLVFQNVTYYFNGQAMISFDLNMKNAVDFDKFLAATAKIEIN